MMEDQLLGDKISRFTANKKSFAAIRSEVDSNMGSSIPQPVLIIGNEGSGKTKLLKRIISEYPLLRYVWIDGRSIFDSADIINRAKDVSLVIIDDLDYYLKRCSYDEQFRLRRFLYNEGAPMLIASVKKLYPALTEYKAPFFEGLKKIHLQPISVDVLEALFDKKSLDRAVRMYNITSPTIRSVEIIYNIIQTAPDPNRDIDTLLSYFSDRYSLIYQSVPINSQRILNICCFSGSGLTVPELRDKSNLASGTLTPYLRNLCKRGLVTADKSIKRNTKYLVTDPLFRVWLRCKTVSDSNTETAIVLETASARLSI